MNDHLDEYRVKAFETIERARRRNLIYQILFGISAALNLAVFLVWLIRTFVR